ncbi:hypothetical protein ACHWQZ_G000674 [Mnemiopsis leidyi]
MILFVVALIAVTTAQDQVNPDIVYKYTDAFQLIWKDAGSGARMDGSVWRALNYQSDYCSLGDHAVEGWSKPTTKGVLVAMRKAGALVHPSSFTRVWKDSGSGAHADVAIYKMNAPSGYTCLGGVAMGSHSDQPDSSKYCCVKKEYLVQGETEHTWNDVDSGADSDVSLWTVITKGSDPFGLGAGNFIGVSGYSRPAASAAYLLKADGNKVRDVWSLPNGDDKPLNLYEVAELKMIWNDAGSGAKADCSIWRAESREGYYPVGDIVVASHSKPALGFLLKATDKDEGAVRLPVSYSRIWNDRGSGADRDVQLWKANCPPGYVALGDVATSGAYPAIGDIYCVNSEYASYGSSSNWGYIWRDYGSGADADVSIYEAKAVSTSEQSVRAFRSVASHSSYPSHPYLLKKEFINYWAEKPIEKIFMYNVKYDLESERQQTAPVKMSPTVVENHSDVDQTVTREITYSVAETSSFTFSQSIQLGIAVEITAGSPIIGIEQATTISAEATSEFTSGDETTTTLDDTISATINLEPKSKVTAVITATKYKADIPYTATVKKIYFDGSQAFATISGVYKGTTVSEAKVVVGETEYFE